ncbi:MAG: flagellar assembly protein A, partial [Bacillota bacterium]|nr:flagellar assembly protein A [Bacillota bacterium]
MKDNKEDKILSEVLSLSENMDGFRIIDFDEDGVYLSVHPPVGSGISVNIEKLLEELQLLKLTDLDKEAVKAAVQFQTGERLKVAPPQEEIKKDGIVKVEVSRDKMKAWLTIFPPLGGKPINFSQCEAALIEAGIVFGIMKDEINKALNQDKVSETLLVALGQEPIHGDDAVIDYKFNYKKDKLVPKMLDDGNVDFYNLDLVTNVRTGE